MNKLYFAHLCALIFLASTVHAAISTPYNYIEVQKKEDSFTELIYTPILSTLPTIKLELLNGKFKLFSISNYKNSHITWIIIPAFKKKKGYAQIIGQDLFDCVHKRIKQFGLAYVEKKCFWPVGHHGFPYGLKNGMAPYPKLRAAKTARSLKGLKLLRAEAFEGHTCTIYQSLPVNEGNAGSSATNYWIDTRTHYIWRTDELQLPPADSPQPPSKFITRIGWIRKVHINPSDYVQFPEGVEVIVPECFGPIAVPPGGIRKTLSPQAAYLGHSIQWWLTMLRKIHPGNTPVYIK